PAPALPPLVGRDRVLDELLASIEPLRAGPVAPVLVLVSGEPGSGKSRLLDAVRVRLRAAADPPARPVLVSAEACAKDPGGFLGELVRRLADAAGEARRTRLFDRERDGALRPILSLAPRRGSADSIPADGEVALAPALDRLVARASARCPLALL